MGGGTKIYVGNLSWETSWQDLKDHFRQAGEVMHADIMLGADGRSKGCGLVTFSNAHDAARAIGTLHDSVLHSRSIFVREDREAALPGLPAPSSGRGTAGMPGSLPPPTPTRNGAHAGVVAEPGAKVFVGNLSFDTSWQDLKDHFRQAGEVIHADVMLGADGRSKGCGMVAYSNAREAAHAISTLNQTTVGGRAIFVREVVTRKSNRSPQPLPRILPGLIESAHFAAHVPHRIAKLRYPAFLRPTGLLAPLTVCMHAVLRKYRTPSFCRFMPRFSRLNLRHTQQRRHSFAAPSPSPRLRTPSPRFPRPSHSRLSLVVCLNLFDLSPASVGSPTQQHSPPPFGGGLPPARSPSRQPMAGTPGGGAGTGTKVYVGNLAWETSWQDLKDHFRQAGEVMHADIMLGADGRSKGCGLVTFSNAHDAARAIGTLHDSVLHSRSIFVREDREPITLGSPSGGFGKGGGKGGPAVPSVSNGCQVFVGNLPWDVAWQALKDHFRAAGNVMHADVMVDGEGRSRGFGTVLFSTTREAAKAIQLFNESFLLGRQIEVRPDQHR